MQSSYQFENVVLAVAAATSRSVRQQNAVQRKSSRQRDPGSDLGGRLLEGAPRQVPDHGLQPWRQAGVRFEPIPTQVLSALSAADDSNNDWQAGNSRMDEEGYAKGDQDDADAVSDVPRSVWRALAPFSGMA